MSKSAALRSALLFSAVISITSSLFAGQYDTPSSVTSISKQAEKDLTWLADDARMGRGITTPGINEAADYVAARFAKLGLKRLPGQQDFFWQFSMRGQREVDSASTLKLGGDSLKLDTDYRPAGLSAEKDFSGPVVFAGYGIKRDGYDDYAGIDAKGKIVLAMRYEPHNEKGEGRFGENGRWSEFSSLAGKAEQAANAGATALLVVNPPTYHDDAEKLVSLGRSRGSRTAIPVLSISVETAQKLLSAGGLPDLAELQKTTDAQTPASKDLANVTLEGNVKFRTADLPLKDVVAYLPGTGPQADEFIIVGAHYDHVGMGGMGSRSPGVTKVHNGADDNGSGTTAMLGLAEQLTLSGRPHRSIIFMGFSAEEMGLVGSQRFAAKPPIDLSKVVAMVNLDMVGRVRSNVLYMGGQGTAAEFDRFVEAADERSPLTLKVMTRGGKGPSDHASFSEKKIPVLFLFSGLHKEYHTPDDDVSLINFQGIAYSVGLAYDLVKQIDQMDKPAYVDTYDRERINLDATDPDNKEAQKAAASSGEERPRQQVRVTLGVVPDYGTEESTSGVKISGVTDGSPAAKAGLKAGDLIKQIGDRKMSNLYDLTDFLTTGKPGEKVKVVFLRDGAEQTLEATLEERNPQQ